MNKLREQAKGYIQIEEMSRFKNKVQKAREKWDKREVGTRTELHKLDKKYKLDKCHPLLRGPRYERYTPHIPLKLPLAIPPRLRLDRTKHCRYHHNYGHNTKDCWSLKNKIEELIQAGISSLICEEA